MTYEELLEAIKNTPPIPREQVEEALKKFNERMDEAKRKFEEMQAVTDELAKKAFITR